MEAERVTFFEKKKTFISKITGPFFGWFLKGTTYHTLSCPSIAGGVSRFFSSVRISPPHLKGHSMKTKSFLRAGGLLSCQETSYLGGRFT